jgi:pre-mRNA-processing factor 6
LNAARKAVPTSYEVWIAAARLQEQMGTFAKVNVIQAPSESLLDDTTTCKNSAFGFTFLGFCDPFLSLQHGILSSQRLNSTLHDIDLRECTHLFIQETLGWGLDEDDDRKDIWMDDAKASIARGNYELRLHISRLL